MSDDTTHLSATEKAQISANLRLTARFIQELIDTPEQFAALPDSGTVVLLPPDDAPDTELTFANIEMAKQLATEGKRPILWAVGMPLKTGPQAIGRLPIVREDQFAIRYDQHHDVLSVAFSQTDRPTMPLRHHPLVITLVDPETFVVISYTIPNFLGVVAPRSLPLFDVLLLSTTELIGITREEVVERRNALAHGRPLPTREQRVDLGEIFEELALLSA